MTTAPPTDEEQLDHVDAGGSGPDPDLPPFVLPPSRGRRAVRRREERRRRLRRRATRVGGIGAAAVVALVIALALHGPGLSSRDKGARAAAPASAAVTRTAVLVQLGPNGGASSITLLTAGPGGNDHVVFVPPGTMTEVPAFGLDAVGKASTYGGPALLQATLENLLGIGVDDLVVLDDAELAALVRPAGDLTVSIPDRVEDVAPGGQVNVRWEAGPTIVGAEEVGSLLTVKGEGTDLSRLARQQAFWEAWLAALRARPASLPPAGADHGLRPVLQALAAQAPVYDILPVEAVDAGGGDELYRVRQDELDALMKQAAPGAVAASRSGRIRVQVLNGTGVVGLAQQVTVRLVQAPTRARVLYTGNADRFDHDVTQIVFYDRSQRAMAERVRAALGVGELVLSRRPIDIVDVTVVVGRDFR